MRSEIFKQRQNFRPNKSYVQSKTFFQFIHTPFGIRIYKMCRKQDKKFNTTLKNITKLSFDHTESHYIMRYVEIV